jgi:hypothetical protein
MMRLLVTSRRKLSIENASLDLVTIPLAKHSEFSGGQGYSNHVQAQLQGHPKMRRWPNRIQQEVEQVLTVEPGVM